MERNDRLTTLIDKFKLTVSSAVPKDANLVVHTAPDGTPDPYKVMLYHVQTTSDPDMAPETKQDKTSPAIISTPIKATPTTIDGTDWSYSKIYKRVDPTSYAAMDTAAYLPVKTKAGA